MYGHIHVIIKDLVISEFSEEKWAMVLHASGYADADVLDTVPHPDAAAGAQPEETTDLRPKTCLFLLANCPACCCPFINTFHSIRGSHKNDQERHVFKNSPSIRASFSQMVLLKSGGLGISPSA